MQMILLVWGLQSGAFYFRVDNLRCHSLVVLQHKSMLWNFYTLFYCAHQTLHGIYPQRCNDPFSLSLDEAYSLCTSVLPYVAALISLLQLMAELLLGPVQVQKLSAKRGNIIFTPHLRACAKIGLVCVICCSDKCQSIIILCSFRSNSNYRLNCDFIIP